jgi:menaquinone-dependent protoporphyrinogen oxidase
MAKILILFSTTDGHTVKICKRLQDAVEQDGHRATLVSIAEPRLPDLDAYDKIVIGASIRYGKHSKAVVDFIEGNWQLLERKPNAFFSVNIVARKPEKSEPETNPYLQKFLRQIAWRPGKLAVFAGKLDYPRYRPFDRFMIRLIMLITKGPTDPATVVEFTDWKKVEAFGRVISEM